MGTHAECTPAQSPERAGGHQAQGRAGAVRERATWAGRGHAGGERGADVGDVTARGEALPRAPRLARALRARLRRARPAAPSEAHGQPLGLGWRWRACLPARRGQPGTCAGSQPHDARQARTPGARQASDPPRTSGRPPRRAGPHRHSGGIQRAAARAVYACRASAQGTAQAPGACGSCGRARRPHAAWRSTARAPGRGPARQPD